MSVVLRGRFQELNPARAARFAAYAFMLTMPWAGVFAVSVNPHDAARMFQSLVLIASAFALFRLGGPWWPSARTGTAVLLAVLVFGGLSVGLAEKPSYAALEASSIMLLVLMAIALGRTDAEVLLRELPAVLALSALLSVLLELPRLLYFLSDGRVPQAADFGFMYMSHRFFNHAQSVMLPMAFLPLLIPCARWVRIAAWIGVIGGLALLLRTGGRGTLVAMGLFAVALPFALRSNARAAVRTLVRAGIGAVIAYLACFVLPAALLGLAQDHRGNAGRIVGASDSGRFYLWKLAVEDALQHPWFGIGPMHYAHQPNLLAAHPHNSLLQWSAEWGIPMTLCAVAALATLLFRAGRVLRTSQRADSNAFLAIVALAVLVAGIDSLFSGTLVMPVSETWWFIALGCTMAALPERPASMPRAGLALRNVLVAALVALHVGLSVWTYKRSIQPPQVTEGGLQRTNVPRYWINGFF